MFPDWYEQGLAHVWLPYCQMQLAPAPLAAVRTYGCRIVLADVITPKVERLLASELGAFQLG